MKTSPVPTGAGIASCLFCLALLAPLPGRAETAEIDDKPLLTLRGFGTLGLVRTNSDDIQFVRDLSQPDGANRDWTASVDSILGIQATWQLTPVTESVVQAISRYRYDGSYRPEISWAFVRHQLSPDTQIRVGRLGTEFYLLADSRWVGYANLPVRPPPDYYGPLIISYLDGFDLSTTLPWQEGLVRGKLFAGLAAEKSPFVMPLQWDLRNSPMVGGHLDFLNGPWQFRAGHTRIRFKHELPVNELVGFDLLSQAPGLSIRNTRARFNSLGLAYDGGPLQLQGMVSHIAYESSFYEDSRAGFAIASYRLARFTPYLGYSRVVSKPGSAEALATPALQPTVANLMASSHSNQHSLFLGLRWDFQHNLALKAQLDRVRGSTGSVFPVREPDNDNPGHYTVISFTLDFVF